MESNPITTAIDLDSNQPQKVYQQLGNQLLRDQEFEQAEEVFQKLSETYPEKPQGYQGLARVAMANQNFELAQQRWEKVLELFPDNILALAGLSNTLIELKEYQQAEENFQELIKKYPDKPQGYEGLANLARASYQWELVVQWWDTSIAKTRAKSSYLKKARFLVQYTKYEEGFALINNLIAEHGKDLPTLKTKADLLISAARFEEAIELLCPLQNETTETLPIQILLAQALIGGKRFEEASLIVEKLPSSFQKQANNYYSSPSSVPNRIIKLLKTWQKYYQAGISLDQPKIFGIGLSRTGTTSLTEALNTLGYAVLHFINPVTKKIIDLEDIFYYDAFTDSPIAFRFEELYFLFPNAKFIYTERNLEDWVKSSSNLYQHRHFSTTKGMKAWLTQQESGNFDKSIVNYSIIYRCAYESLYGRYSTWEDSYHAFENRVTNFFADKPPEKLLRLNICAGEGWEKLCQFLDVSIPEQSFPYYNKEKPNYRPYNPTSKSQKK